MLLSNLVLGGMCYESNQQLTEVKNHYNYSNELNEELYDELNGVSRELEEQIYKTTNSGHTWDALNTRFDSNHISKSVFDIEKGNVYIFVHVRISLL